MKVRGSIYMYCGRRDPETYFSYEQSKKINELLYHASEPSDDHSIRYKMPPNGYMVWWQPEDDNYGNCPAVHLHVARGTIALYCYGTVNYLKDTVGLEDYLKEILTPILKKHIEDGQKAMEEYMFKLKCDEIKSK
jgi:hypothetical protein